MTAASTRLRAQLAAGLVLGLLAATCSDGSTNGTSTPTAGVTPSPTTPTASPITQTTSPTTPTTSATSDRRGFNLIGWILGLGPSAPSPSGFRQYGLLLDRRCAELFREVRDDDVAGLDGLSVTLYRGTASACMAAGLDETPHSGDPEGDLPEDRNLLWQTAEEAHATVTARIGKLACFELAAAELLERLVAHRSDPPGFEPAADEQGKVEPPCPKIDCIEPHRGPTGSDVTVTGQHLDVLAGDRGRVD